MRPLHKDVESVVLFFKGHDSLLPFTVKNITNAPMPPFVLGQTSKTQKSK